MSTAAKKTVQKRAPAAHPSYKEMAMAAVKATHTKNGSSRAAIKKYVEANYSVKSNQAKIHLKRALKSLVDEDALKTDLPKAPRSYRLTIKEPPKKNKTASAQKKKPAAKKPKTTPVKKAAAKKPKAKKTATGTKKATVKKVAKKPAAKKATKKTPKKSAPK
uniref:histone H1-beta, late embryonic-like n=1 Tax=Styela clava TaxID=7725 RepID=UPI0019394272|nr:histone H1-beta, late embryonic-like [Styela clava]